MPRLPLRYPLYYMLPQLDGGGAASTAATKPLHRWVVLELRRLEVHVADGTRHLDDPLHPPRAAGVDHDLAVVGVERGELPPDLLRGHVVLSREPLGDGLIGCRAAAEDGAGVAGVGDVEHVAGDGAQEAAGARGGRAGTCSAVTTATAASTPSSAARTPS
ncbi:hypothetical protein OsJ_05836 [Oryza sativa Japonica Group]|uniref:Uncharacterized protein n=1 Tax=Oryza sativa subsp. japonica TaxID=39947 RepID=B9F3Y1_ORYSJ|nr:hypothetical protein OsJ_05836 [Oryza sativa Japonica Group]